jgi:hypothetical protein
MISPLELTDPARLCGEGIIRTDQSRTASGLAEPAVSHTVEVSFPRGIHVIDFPPGRILLPDNANFFFFSLLHNFFVMMRKCLTSSSFLPSWRRALGSSSSSSAVSPIGGLSVSITSVGRGMPRVGVLGRSTSKNLPFLGKLGEQRPEHGVGRGRMMSSTANLASDDESINFKRKVFCNVELHGDAIDAIGFDMDFTLAQVSLWP